MAFGELLPILLNLVSSLLASWFSFDGSFFLVRNVEKTTHCEKCSLDDDWLWGFVVQLSDDVNLF